jgi:GAF domain-containing protein
MQARFRLLQYALTHSLGELLRETLDEAERLTGSAIGFYHFLEEDQQTISLQAWSSRTLAEFCTAEVARGHYPLAEAGVWVDCIQQRRPVIHNDYPALSHRKGLPEGHAPLQRELVVPVFRGEEIVAVLGVGNKPMAYDARDVETVSLLADLTWSIAEQKRTQELLMEGEKRYRRLVELSPDAIFLHVAGRFVIVTTSSQTFFAVTG